MASFVKPTLWVSFVLALGLVHCSGDDKKVVRGEAGSGAEGGGDGEPSSGGSDSGAQGGAPVGEAGASVGAQAGSGELPGGGGSPGGGGEAAGGMSNGGGDCTEEPDPTNCCQADDPPCVDGWELACYNNQNTDQFCCDAEQGIRRSCRNDGDFYRYSDTVCLDPCTGKSFGTASCDECLTGAPPCTAFGACDLDSSVCEDASAGYLKSCDSGVQVECVCDPAL